VLEEADQAPIVHAYVQVEVSLNNSLNALSVPQENPELGVQAALDAGALPEQKELATVLESLRTQVTLRVSVEELGSTTQVPVRVWVRPVPQPVLGTQGA
jgi:hypothetical protein